MLHSSWMSKGLIQSVALYISVVALLKLKDYFPIGPTYAVFTVNSVSANIAFAFILRCSAGLLCYGLNRALREQCSVSSTVPWVRGYCVHVMFHSLLHCRQSWCSTVKFPYQSSVVLSLPSLRLQPTWCCWARLHSALLRLPARRLDALSVRHLLEHSGPRPLRLIDLSAPGSADLPLLAAALEHPLLEVTGGRLVPDLSLWELHLSWSMTWVLDLHLWNELRCAQVWPFTKD